ncbi:MAG: hypothetical protein HQK91_02700 [Nitrospirae bacterium]|nr:hypothetical protein [Nitrospirota bacterium]MBF0540344.1 hypothetical protein [Nitrospirota bacterium]
MVQINTNYSGAPTSKITSKYKITPQDTETKSTTPKDTVSLSKESENALLKQMLIEKEKNRLAEKENQLNAKDKFLTEQFDKKEKMLTEQIAGKEKELSEKATLNERFLDEKRDNLRKEKEQFEKEKKEESEKGGLSHIFTGIKKIFLPNS